MINRRAYLRLFRDQDSSTGASAEVLIKNVRPRSVKIGRHEIAEAKFRANFVINVEGYKVKPEVEVKIWAQLPPETVKQIYRKRKRERALNGSPMLFE